MASSYPGTLDSFATTRADATVTATTHAADHNDHADAINKIEAELGTDPSGPRATVLERIGNHVTALVAPGTATAPTNVTVSSPGATLDGISMTAGDRVLLAFQTAPAENGVWVWNGAASAMTRAPEATHRDSLLVMVEQGSNADTAWELVTNNPITLGTTAQRFTRVLPDYAVPMTGPATRLWLPTGAKIMNMRAAEVGLANAAALTSGVLRLTPLGIVRAGDTLAALTYIAANTAAGTPTNQWACLVRVSDRKIMAVSPDATTAAWAANTAKTFTFNSAYTTDRDELMWGGLMVAATTVPTLAGQSPWSTAQYRTPVFGGTSNAGLTSPLTVGTVVNAPAALAGFAYVEGS